MAKKMLVLAHKVEVWVTCAEYLDKLAKGLNISQQASNDFHERVGAPKLYS